jgi:RecA/RadA recombinase
MARKKVKSNMITMSHLQSKYEGSGIVCEVIPLPDEELWVPTSSPPVNYVLGGGFAYGRIAEISGLESCGKCVGLDSYLFICNRGIFLSGEEESQKSHFIKTPIGEARMKGFIDTGVLQTLRIKTSQGYECSFGYDNHKLKILNTRGEWEWKFVKDLGLGDILPIKFGMECYGDQEHSIGELKLNPEMAWVLGTLMGDGCMTNGFSISSHPDDVEILEKVLSFIKLHFKLPSGEGSQASIQSTSRGLRRIQIGFPSVLGWLSNFPELQASSHNKRVPSLIFTSPLEVQAAFLRGYFDTDGSSNNLTISASISSVSKGAMLDVQQMLLNMGIVSYLKEKATRWGDPGRGYKSGVSYRLSLRGYQAFLFRDLIGFSLARKQVRLEMPRRTHRSPLFTGLEDYSNLDPVHLPISFYPILEALADKAREWGSKYHYKDNRATKTALVSPTPIRFWLYGRKGELRRSLGKANIPLKNLKLLLDFWAPYLSLEREFKILSQVCDANCLFDTIVNIESRVEPTVDTEVKDHHSYISSGFLSHNTLIALDTIRSAQKLGGMGIFIDAEYAFSRSWAELNGLDLDNLYIYQENMVEPISDFMAEAAIHYRGKYTNNEPIVMVVDSIAAMDTIAAMESSELDAKAEMGSRAKAIYKMLRIRNRLWHKLGITVIFINQLRDTINTGFAARFQEDKVTPGGRAMKFYASQRIYLETKRQLTTGSKDNKHRYGIEVLMTVKKNKLAIPRTPRRFEVIFDPEYGTLGFDRRGDLANILLKEEAIMKEGNKYYLLGEEIASNLTELGKVVRTDKDLRASALKEAKIMSLTQMEERLDGLVDNRFPVSEVTFTAHTQTEEEGEDE